VDSNERQEQRTHNSTYPKVAVQWSNLPALPLRQAGQALCPPKADFCLVDSEVLRNRHLRVAATVDEIRKIINSITNLKHRAIISTIYSCGLRISEAVNLKINDIDSSAMTVKIVNAKGRNDRIVMLSEKLLSLLREYFKEYKPKAYLFEGQKGEKYSSRSIQQIFNNAVKKVGIKKKVTVHSLRHSFASHLLDNGTDIRFIQELLGHKHLSTTQIYTLINPASVKKIKSPFDNI